MLRETALTLPSPAFLVAIFFPASPNCLCLSRSVRSHYSLQRETSFHTRENFFCRFQIQICNSTGSTREELERRSGLTGKRPADHTTMAGRKAKEREVILTQRSIRLSPYSSYVPRPYNHLMFEGRRIEETGCFVFSLHGQGRLQESWPVVFRLCSSPPLRYILRSEPCCLCPWELTTRHSVPPPSSRRSSSSNIIRASRRRSRRHSSNRRRSSSSSRKSRRRRKRREAENASGSRTSSMATSKA